MDKLIITAAVTGSLTTREQNQSLPHTPREIAEATIDAYKAGASVVHLHVRDPLTGRPVQDVKLFTQTIESIREACDIVVNVSTGGAPGMTPEERIAVVPALSAKASARPEMCSLNAGSVNFGIFSRRRRAFVLDAVQLNPWSQLLHYADTMTGHGIKPEIEIYEAGMINNATFLREVGALKDPLHFQFVLGVLGAMPSTVDGLMFLRRLIPCASTWSLCTVGPEIFSLGAVAIAAGGHVRVGLEDSVYIAAGKLADSTAQMVSKIAEISKAMGRHIATPDDARSILNLV